MDTRIAKVDEGWQVRSGAPGWTDGSGTKPVPAALDAAVIAGIRELQDGEDDLLSELIDIFVRDVPPRLAELAAGVARGDAGVLRTVAHSLKGSSGSLGAQHMAALCARLEHNGRAGVIEDAARLIDEIGIEFDRVRIALETERAK